MSYPAPELYELGEALKRIKELEQQRDELVAALNVELGMWKYDKEYKMSDYSRIHLAMRIEAITAAPARGKKWAQGPWPGGFGETS